MITSTASNEDDTTASSDGCNVRAETTKGDGLVLEIQTTSHGVDNRLGLLENLLLHEVVELALHDLLELELESLDGTDIGAAVSLLETVNVEGALMDVGNVVILKVHNLLGMLDNGSRVGGQEELGGHGHAIVSHEGTRLRAVEQGLVGSRQHGGVGGQEVVRSLLEGSVLRGGLGGQSTLLRVLDIDKVNLHALLGLDTNDEGRTLTGSDNLVGVVNRLDQQTVSTLELVDDGLGEVDEAEGGVLVVDVLGQLGNTLGIGLGLESQALGLQESLELLVVGNDTIVDNGELPVGIRSVFNDMSAWSTMILLFTLQQAGQEANTRS